VVSIRLPDKEVWEKAKLYARENGLTMGKLIVSALELYMSKEDRMLYELKCIREELSELKKELNELTKSSTATYKNLPSLKKRNVTYSAFFKDNPWVEILSKRE